MGHMNQQQMNLAEEMGISPRALDREAFHKAGRCPVHGGILTERKVFYKDEMETVDYCMEGEHEVTWEGVQK
jgi:hypothetical protein